MKRTATSVWKGSAKEGKGSLSTLSGAFDNHPYSFQMRFENEDGKQGTNPEELIGAAHAGCFNMALAVGLGKQDITPEELITKAEVILEKGDVGFSITQINLNLTGKVPGMSDEEFSKAANGAKENCPVSKALAGVKINLNVRLEN